MKALPLLLTVTGMLVIIREIRAQAPSFGPGKGQQLPAHYLQRSNASARGAALSSSRGEISGDAAKVEAATTKGLQWLQRAQLKNGSWEDKHGVTGLAMLALLGQGETPGASNTATIQKAAAWVATESTKFDGRPTQSPAFLGNPVEHAILASALVEHYVYTRDPAVFGPTNRALTTIVEAQGKDGGWDSSLSPLGFGNLWTTGWMVHALRTAEVSGLNTPAISQSIDNSVQFIKQTQGPDGRFAMYDFSRYSKIGGDGFAANGARLVAATDHNFCWGGVALLVSGIRPGKIKVTEDSFKKAVPYTVAKEGREFDYEAYYFQTLGCHLRGTGTARAWWNLAMVELLKKQQSDGSWTSLGQNWAPTNSGLSAASGHSADVYRTALCLLMLEAHYRVPRATR